ncbi:protein Hook homolog 3-like [Scomber japonicus]|uniref:protein Hook homolog 3-like n=1 Tax=Scomber japonicus TaxID=13676 RepID=UPI002305344E|nr:protein Hook homolog 3-like [Scomber japonicus]
MTSNEKTSPFDTMAPEDSQGDNTKSREEQEEKLILTAWQSMSSVLQLQSLFEDSTAPGLGQSFLAKQRQSTHARRVFSPWLQPR